MPRCVLRAGHAGRSLHMPLSCPIAGVVLLSVEVHSPITCALYASQAAAAVEETAKRRKAAEAVKVGGLLMPIILVFVLLPPRFNQNLKKNYRHGLYLDTYSFLAESADNESIYMCVLRNTPQSTDQMNVRYFNFSSQLEIYLLTN